MISRVAFITSARNPQSASGLLRSHQLRQLVAPLLAEKGVETVTTDRAKFRNSIVVLNKNVLHRSKATFIERLQKKGNVVVADPVDGRVTDDVLSGVDVLLASSMSQLHDFKQRFPNQRIAYVAHHVDLRINSIAPPADRMRIGYFGELGNAMFVDQLAEVVSFVWTDTSRATDAGWIDDLRNYNAHYNIRAPKPNDGHKPFTKGFIAAHCGCPILVSNDDQEASFLLPADYPYFVSGNSVDQIREMIARMKDDFGGSDWRRAISMMRDLRDVSSPITVAQQFCDGIATELDGGRRYKEPARRLKMPVSSIFRKLRQRLRGRASAQ